MYNRIADNNQFAWIQEIEPRILCMDTVSIFILLLVTVG